MEVINISKNKLNSLTPLVLPSTVLSTECELFELTYKKELKLLKRLYQIDSMSFANKLYTLEALNINKEKMPNNFILPEFLVSINKQVEAFVMKYVKGINLSIILKSEDIPVEEKKHYLKRVGMILEQMKNIRTYTSLKDFYIGDLHEDNFIVNSSQKDIYVLDLDSCKIAGNKSFVARYLTPLALLSNVNGKYKEEYSPNTYAEYRVDENTDIYCYVIMILNYLYNGRINNVSLEEYYNFINYLCDIGVDRELLKCLTQILTTGSNINPVDYIETLTEKQVAKARHLYPKK